MVVRAWKDRSYDWRCEGCGKLRHAAAHRGPRARICRTCQNVRSYRKRKLSVERLTAATANSEAYCGMPSRGSDRAQASVQPGLPTRSDDSSGHGA